MDRKERKKGENIRGGGGCLYIPERREEGGGGGWAWPRVSLINSAASPSSSSSSPKLGLAIEANEAKKSVWSFGG